MALLKDEINAEVVADLADAFRIQYPPFDRDAFTATIMAELHELELKDRMNLIADTMAERLPADYEEALSFVVAVADTGLDAWAAWPLCSFVERHGTDHPEASLTAMASLTKRFSCEFAIRPFLDQHLDLTRTHMRRWTADEDEAVRRLPSEGSRPLLPWGPKVAALIEDPHIGLEAITALRHDPSETVRRSVANHLNDLAKLQPALVIETLEAWTSEAVPVDDKMVRHALRTLIKKGDPAAMQLLGFTTEPQVEVAGFTCRPATVSLGDHIELAATLRSTTAEDQHLVVDFVIHHVNASGATSPKVFKWTTTRLAGGSTADLTKRRLIQTASTRRYHPGIHRVDLHVAGHTVATTQFDLGPLS